MERVGSQGQHAGIFACRRKVLLHGIGLSTLMSSMQPLPAAHQLHLYRLPFAVDLPARTFSHLNFARMALCPAPADGESGWRFDAVTEHTALETTGGRVWPAAHRLATFLAAEAHTLGLDREGISILELGAGCGWLGITLARNLPGAACICLTEQGQGVAWLQHNVQLNAGLPGVEQHIVVAPCDWNDFVQPATAACPTSPGQPEMLPLPLRAEHASSSSSRPTMAGKVGRVCAQTGQPWDFIIGSDLIYTEGGCQMLPLVFKGLAIPGRMQFSIAIQNTGWSASLSWNLHRAGQDVLLRAAGSVRWGGIGINSLPESLKLCTLYHACSGD